ncbi:MAG: radical SAM protein [PVC group bacterium]|nr:radical SAM protein [PVC group bacterium]
MINVNTRNISPEVAGTDKQLGLVFNDKKWIEYRRKWDENPKQGIVEKVPLQIDLFAVDICNLKCPMCPRQAFIPGKGYMDTKSIKRILDQGAEHGLCAFNFSGLGEPTLHPDVLEIIRYAKEKGVVDVNMHTNGTRLGAEFNKKLLESGLDRLIVSLDSADKQRYESIRIGASFEKVYAGVEDLIKQRNDHKSARLHIKANFIEMDEKDDTEKNKFITYWKGKVDRIAVLRYLDCKDVERLFWKENYVQDNDFCCPELWRRLIILSDGTATLCPRDMQKHHIIGNVNDKTISEIWTGEKIQKIRDMHRKGCFKELGFCADCPDSYDKKKDEQKK